MTMTIEEKYNNAIQMFRSYYDGKNENLRITSTVLEENGFGEDFWSMLCPRLNREGILKEWPTFFRGFEYVNQPRADAIWNDLQRIDSYRMERDLRKGIFKFGFVHDRHSIRIMEESQELEKKEPQLKKELESLPRMHTFVIDGKKLDATHKEHQEKTSATDWAGERRQKDRLNFNPESGEIEFGGETGIAKSGDKDYALVALLHRNPNTPFTIESIQEKCNLLVNKDAHKFKAEKDIDDTVRQIRFKLKVNKGAFFPIVKKEFYGNKSWLLTNK